MNVHAQRGARRNAGDEGEDRQEEDHDDDDQEDDYDDDDGGDEDDEQDGGPEAAGAQRAAGQMHNMLAGERGLDFGAMAMQAIFGEFASTIPENMQAFARMLGHAHGGFGQEEESDDEDDEGASVD